MAKNPDDGFQWFEADLSDVLYLLRRHLALLLLAPLVGFVLAVLVTLMMRPVFSTDALVYLRPNFDKDMQIEQVFSKLEDDDSLRSIERSMIADTVILQMVERLGLRDEENFLGKGALDEGPLSDAKLLEMIRERYRTELVPTTRLVELGVDDYSADRAVLIADTLIDEFLKHLGNDRKIKEIELREALIVQAKTALEATLEQEAKLENFRTDHPELLVEQDSEIFQERLLQQGGALNEANAEMARLAGSMAALASIDPQQDPYRVFQVLSNRNSEYLSNLLSMLASAKADLAAVKQRATERNPDYQAAQSRHEQVEATVSSYAMEMKNAVESEFRAATEKVAKLNEALIGLQGDFVGFKSTSAEFRGIKEEIDRNWNTYAKLQQKIMDLDLEPETTPTFITVVSEPIVPDKKAKPYRLLWAAGGLFLGGLFALGRIVLRNYRGLPFTSMQQASERLGVPAVVKLEVPRRGSVNDRLAVAEKLPQLLNVLIALRNSKTVHITSLNQSSAVQLLPELIGRVCGRHELRTLWLSFGYAATVPAKVLSGGSVGLSTLELPADQLLDPDTFGKGLERLRSEFDRILVDTTGLAESEARCAVSQVVKSTLLIIDGDEVPRSEYERFMSRSCGDAAGSASEVALVYLTRSDARRKERDASPVTHSFSEGPVPVREPAVSVSGV